MVHQTRSVLKQIEEGNLTILIKCHGKLITILLVFIVLPVFIYKTGGTTIMMMKVFFIS